MIARVVAGVRRLLPWYVATIALSAVVAAVAPQQGDVLAYKLVLVTIAIKLAYWADRSLFANAPAIDQSLPRDVVGAARLIARALIALAVILGLTLGI